MLLILSVPPVIVIAPFVDSPFEAASVGWPGFSQCTAWAPKKRTALAI